MEEILDLPSEGSNNLHLNYAGFWIRFAAYLIDLILVIVVVIILMFAFDMFETSEGIVNLMYFSIMLVYYSVMESSSTQGTLGKMALKLKVGDKDGNRLTYMNALGRYFAKIPSGMILGIGYLMAAWDEKKRALHDKIADTYVYQS